MTGGADLINQDTNQPPPSAGEGSRRPRRTWTRSSGRWRPGRRWRTTSPRPSGPLRARRIPGSQTPVLVIRIFDVETTRGVRLLPLLLLPHQIRCDHMSYMYSYFFKNINILKHSLPQLPSRVSRFVWIEVLLG